MAEIVRPMLIAEGSDCGALLRDLAQADGHLRWAQGQDRDGEEDGFVLLAHGLNASMTIGDIGMAASQNA